ncbi:ABC transporter substrate-binding protein [Pseudomonadota bacterium]
MPGITLINFGRLLCFGFIVFCNIGLAECELDRPIMFAELDWDSNRFHTAVAKHVIEHGYECRVDGIPGSTIPLLTALGRGVPGGVDIVMEVWKDNVTEVWTRMERLGKVRELRVNFPDARQGWFIPKYVVDGDPARGIKAMAPKLKHVRELKNYKHIFTDPEEPDKGRFYNCILGWSCEVVNSNKLVAYGLLPHYVNFRPGAAAALSAAIASAYKRGKPILAYYWSPTGLLGTYDMVQLDEPPFNQKDWESLAKTRKNATAYPAVKVVVAVNTKFYQQAPKLSQFLSHYQTSTKIIKETLIN